MLPRFSHLLRHSPTHSIMSRAITCIPHSHFYSLSTSNYTAALHFRGNSPRRISSALFDRTVNNHHPQLFQGVRASAGGHREYRKVRRRTPRSKQKELELSVDICIEEDLPDDPEILVCTT